MPRVFSFVTPCCGGYTARLFCILGCPTLEEQGDANIPKGCSDLICRTRFRDVKGSYTGDNLQPSTFKRPVTKYLENLGDNFVLIFLDNL